MRSLWKQAWGRISLAVALGAFAAYVLLIHDFLAVSRPVSGQVLIVEGWFPTRPAMREAIEQFTRGKYQLVICVGGPVPDKDGTLTRSYAELAANRLVELGFDQKLVRVVAVSEAEDRRTFGSAVAARDWLMRERPDVEAVDVFTLGVHARKSYGIFRKVFEPRFTVGIIAATESAYAPGRWWASRAGWYIVVRNTLGYLHSLAQPG
jgi:hypothetical protein